MSYPECMVKSCLLKTFHYQEIPTLMQVQSKKHSSLVYQYLTDHVIGFPSGHQHCKWLLTTEASNFLENAALCLCSLIADLCFRQAQCVSLCYIMPTSPLHVEGCLCRKRKEFTDLCRNFFFFKLIKFIQKAHSLFNSWKIVGTGFQIQGYQNVKKFQIASKNLLPSNKVPFPYNCVSSNGEKKNNSESGFYMSHSSLSYFKLGKDATHF